MTKRLIAIGVIFMGASLAWLILAGTLASRTDESATSQQSDLSSQWGSAIAQVAPTISVPSGPGAKQRITVPISSTRISTNLELQRRQKGLLWYNLYDVSFSAHYIVDVPKGATTMFLRFTLPDKNATYSDFALLVNGRDATASATATNAGSAIRVPAGKPASIDVRYTTRGMDSWSYSFGSSVASVHDLQLHMTTNFSQIGFPAQTLLPTSETRTANGWDLTWSYDTLLTGNGIGMSIPSPLQPGPLAQRITNWAPIALLFYIFVMLLITTIRRIDLHPMNYFFLASAFFAFHLLFAYLVDRIPLGIAFVICSIVSMALTISYLRLVVGLRFAAVEAGGAQLIYLVLFSWALFNEGWSGLTITIGAIITCLSRCSSPGVSTARNDSRRRRSENWDAVKQQTRQRFSSPGLSRCVMRTPRVASESGYVLVQTWWKVSHFPPSL